MPTWPYPPEVNTDLRDIFQHIRVTHTSRNLGQSSITRGEGSLDLYDTDDGPVVARYGDLPGGAFGVGVMHRGAFWNVSDLIGQGQDHDAAQDSRMDGIDGRLNGHDSRLDGHEGRLDGHATRLGAAEGRLDAHAGRLGNAEGRLDSHVSRIGAAEGRLNDHAGRIGATESKNSAQDTRLDDHVSRIGSAEGSIASNASRLDSHVSRIGASENDIAALQDTIDTLIRRLNSVMNWRGNLVDMSRRLSDIDGGNEFDFPLMN